MARLAHLGWRFPAAFVIRGPGHCPNREGGAHRRPSAPEAESGENHRGARRVPMGAAQQVSLADWGTPLNLAMTTSPVSEGGVLVTWELDELDGDGQSIVARHIDASGQPTGLPWVANLHANGDQTDPTALIRADGGVRIFWQDQQPGATSKILSRHQ